MIIHNHNQWTLEWFECRKWKMTASNAQAIWNVWKWLDTYITELMAEYFSSWEKEQYTNDNIERGKELEEFARSMYELETGNTVQEVWFCEHNEYVWCSPDWLVWEDWWVEIKSQWDVKHFKMILNWEKEIDSSYIWQIQMCLYITGRKWWDFISYNPNYKKSLIIIRILPDFEKHEKLTEWFNYWISKIKEIKSKL
jgi:hypothetical protein